MTPWAVTLPIEFSRQEYWSGLPFSSPGDLPNPGIEPGSPTLQADALTSAPPESEIKSEVAQSCLTLCDPVDSSLPGSSVHEILQAGILQWVAMPSSRGSSQARDRVQHSSTAGRFFPVSEGLCRRHTEIKDC